MTEVRPCSSRSSSCLGLFATRPYSPGDVILEENAPLIRLAPTSVQQEDEIFQQNPHLFPSRASAAAVSTEKKKRGRPKRDHDDDDDKDGSDNNKKRTTLSNSINVPSSVPSGLEGKFKGMVIAALCFRQDQQKQQQQGGTGGASQQADKDKLSKLLQLYHPDISSSSSSNLLSPAEQEIIRVAQLALDFIATPPNNNNNKNSVIADKDNDDDVVLKKIMLIWTCNSFQGGRVYERISRINHSCNPNAVIVVATTATSTTTTKHEEEDDGMQVRAATHIQPGDEIYISYLSLYLYAQRWVRQTQLLQTKHFKCRCGRCCGDGSTTGSSSDSSSAVLMITDTANMIPCPTCHARIPATGYRQLEEDVQYDDDETVAYAVAKKMKKVIVLQESNNQDDDDDWFWECATCQSTFAMSSPPNNGKETKQYDDKNKNQQQQQQHKPLDRPLAAAMQQVVKRVVDFIQDHETLLFARNKTLGSRSNVAVDNDDDDKETAMVLEDLLQEHVTLASNVMGARHWTTNLLLLLQLDTWLSDIHAQLLTRATTSNSGRGNDNDDETNNETLLLESIAQAVDALQRLVQFVNGFSSSSLPNAAAAVAAQNKDNTNNNSNHGNNHNHNNELVLHRGHLLSSVILGTVRALVSLGDAKSQKYASEWLKQLDHHNGDKHDNSNDNFVTLFESPAMQKVVAALRVAWTRNATVASVTAAWNDDEAEEEGKKNNDQRHSNKKLKKG